MADCIDHGMNGTKFGYGRVWFGGKTESAHRVAYSIYNGVSIKQMAMVVIRHTCDNARCVNPQHLISGSHTDNVKDRVDRSRSKGAPRKLSNDEVWFIRKNCKPFEFNKENRNKSEKLMSFNGIAKMLCVDSTVIRNVYIGKTYKDVK